MADWRPLLPRVVHVHLRDAAPNQLSVPWGQGTCEARTWLTALCEAGYHGYVAIEYLEGDANLETSIAQALREVTPMVAQNPC